MLLKVHPLRWRKEQHLLGWMLANKSGGLCSSASSPTGCLGGLAASQISLTSVSLSARWGGKLCIPLSPLMHVELQKKFKKIRKCYRSLRCCCYLLHSKSQSSWVRRFFTLYYHRDFFFKIEGIQERKYVSCSLRKEMDKNCQILNGTPPKLEELGRSLPSANW